MYCKKKWTSESNATDRRNKEFNLCDFFGKAEHSKWDEMESEVHNEKGRAVSDSIVSINYIKKIIPHSEKDWDWELDRNSSNSEIGYSWIEYIHELPRDKFKFFNE